MRLATRLKIAAMAFVPIVIAIVIVGATTAKGEDEWFHPEPGWLFDETVDPEIVESNEFHAIRVADRSGDQVNEFLRRQFTLFGNCDGGPEPILGLVEQDSFLFNWEWRGRVLPDKFWEDVQWEPLDPNEELGIPRSEWRVTMRGHFETRRFFIGEIRFVVRYPRFDPTVFCRSGVRDMTAVIPEQTSQASAAPISSATEPEVTTP
jgi:hypothetical protein